MSNKLDLTGLTLFKEKIDAAFSRKNHKHSASSLEGVVKTVNGTQPDASGNVQVSAVDSATKATKDGNGNVITSTYATKSEVLKGGYGTCADRTAIIKKTTIDGFTLAKGVIVSVYFYYNVQANSSLNVSSTGSKSIYCKERALWNNEIKSGDTATFMYDGTRYQLISVTRVDDSSVSLSDIEKIFEKNKALMMGHTPTGVVYTYSYTTIPNSSSHNSGGGGTMQWNSYDANISDCASVTITVTQNLNNVALNLGIHDIAGSWVDAIYNLALNTPYVFEITNYRAFEVYTDEYMPG